MSAEIMTILKPLLNSKLFEISYLKSNLGCKIYLWSMNTVSKNQKLIKTAHMGTFFTANRFRKKNFLVECILRPQLHFKHSYAIFYPIVYNKCTFEKKIFSLIWLNPVFANLGSLQKTVIVQRFYFLVMPTQVFLTPIG